MLKQRERQLRWHVNIDWWVYLSLWAIGTFTLPWVSKAQVSFNGNPWGKNFHNQFMLWQLHKIEMGLYSWNHHAITLQQQCRRGKLEPLSDIYQCLFSCYGFSLTFCMVKPLSVYSRAQTGWGRGNTMGQSVVLSHIWYGKEHSDRGRKPSE